jgi:sugar phosphate isomerase/epimerase
MRSKSRKNSKIKLSVAYAYAICKYGYPPAFADLDKALAELAAAGFRHTELEGLGRAWNVHFVKHRARYQRMLADLNLNIHNYCIVDPALVSPDRATRRRAYELYDMGCENAAAFGSITVHIATYAPPLKRQRIPYELGKKYNFNLDYRVRVPRGFSWQRVWDVLVESCRRAAETADRYGLDVLVEPRVGETIANTESMLMLIRDVGHRRLKANFDFAHLAAQKETLALSWVKLASRVGGIHIADNNGCDVEHRQIGQGTIDWEMMLRLIADSGYNRYMGLDLFVPPKNALRAFAEAAKRLKTMIRDYGLSDRFELE